MKLDEATPEQLAEWQSALEAEYAAIQAEGLNLDLTRGKPSTEQLALSDRLDGILDGDFKAADGTDLRNYGGLTGLPEARALGSVLMGVPAKNVIAGGNSSLTLMHQAMSVAAIFGFDGPESAWKHGGKTPKFLCPVPGYDRHYAVCEHLGVEMLTVPMTATGPDMDAVEAAVKADPDIKGIWCVPKYSNPTGVTYDDATVTRIAQLPKIAGPGFKVFWDNAYAVHDLSDNPPQLASLFEAAAAAGTEDGILQFASTSKITHAGSGVAFLAASDATLAGFQKSLGIMTIGPDKMNQARHARFFDGPEALKAHMKKHAEIIGPRFETVLNHLDAGFAGTGLGTWERPEGGYFIAFDTRPGLAKEVVKMAKEAGVKLTPAGATFPYGKDPEDRNIRIAPTVPSVEQVDAAMRVFVVCVKLASVRQKRS